jgi:TPR repeat protein
LLERECQAGVAESCKRAGDLWSDGKLERPDGARANDAYARGAKAFSARCDAGDALACGMLAMHCRFGMGIDKDDKRATALIAKACGMGLEGPFCESL